VQAAGDRVLLIPGLATIVPGANVGLGALASFAVFSGGRLVEGAGSQGGIDMGDDNGTATAWSGIEIHGGMGCTGTSNTRQCKGSTSNFVHTGGSMWSARTGTGVAPAGQAYDYILNVVAAVQKAAADRYIAVLQIGTPSDNRVQIDNEGSPHIGSVPADDATRTFAAGDYVVSNQGGDVEFEGSYTFDAAGDPDATWT
jgi:hypothetical protein